MVYQIFCTKYFWQDNSQHRATFNHTILFPFDSKHAFFKSHLTHEGKERKGKEKKSFIIKHKILFTAVNERNARPPGSPHLGKSLNKPQ